MCMHFIQPMEYTVAILIVPLVVEEGWSSTGTKNSFSHSILLYIRLDSYLLWGSRGRDRMIVGFTATYAISAYHY